MIKIVNSVLLFLVLIIAIMLIHQRYKTRLLYAALSQLQNEHENMKYEFTKLETEASTYSSDIILKQLLKEFGLVIPDKKHVLELKNDY